jgi:hypothetical protein
MNARAPVIIIICVSLFMLSAVNDDENGEILFKRYCSRCHGAKDKRSGSLVFYSKNTIVSRYRNRPRQLLYKLRNIEKYSISNIMVTAIHNIEDKKVLAPIVIYLANPELQPDRRKSPDTLNR